MGLAGTGAVAPVIVRESGLTTPTATLAVASSAKQASNEPEFSCPRIGPTTRDRFDATGSVEAAVAAGAVRITASVKAITEPVSCDQRVGAESRGEGVVPMAAHEDVRPLAAHEDVRPTHAVQIVPAWAAEQAVRSKSERGVGGVVALKPVIAGPPDQPVEPAAPV